MYVRGTPNLNFFILLNFLELQNFQLCPFARFPCLHRPHSCFCFIFLCLYIFTSAPLPKESRRASADAGSSSRVVERTLFDGGVVVESQLTKDGNLLPNSCKPWQRM
jgi:hypothetical protein